MGLVHRIVLPCLIGGSLGFTPLGCSGHSTNPPSLASFSPSQVAAPGSSSTNTCSSTSFTIQ